MKTELTDKRRAPPLAIAEETVVFRSDIDIQDVVDKACKRCQIGAGLAAAGFAALVGALSASIPPPAVAVLACGAAANCYGLSVVARRVVCGLATRHVELITVLPTATVMETPEQRAAAAAATAAGANAAAMLRLLGTATAEEQLHATAEVRLELRTALSNRWLTLADVPTEEAEAAGAAVSASFGELCGEGPLQLLHVDLEAGDSPDHALLAALLCTPKAVVDERAEWREDLAAPLRPASSEPPPPGPMLAEVSREELAEASTSNKTPTGQAIEAIGRRAFFGGLSVLGAGGLFAVGESARDPDGAARWDNLPSAGSFL